MAKPLFVASLLVALALFACSRRSSPVQSIDAGDLTSAADAGPQKMELTLSVKAQLPDGGLAPIEPQVDARPRIEPTQKLQLSSNVSLHNYRIRVFDEADRVMISDDEADMSSQGTEYRIFFREPLKPGHRYTLVVDAQTGSSFTDEHGDSQADRRLEFQVAGEKKKEPPRKSSRKKRRPR